MDQDDVNIFPVANEFHQKEENVFKNCEVLGN